VERERERERGREGGGEREREGGRERERGRGGVVVRRLTSHDDFITFRQEELILNVINRKVQLPGEHEVT